jgi:hypothetical protein
MFARKYPIVALYKLRYSANNSSKSEFREQFYRECYEITLHVLILHGVQVMTRPHFRTRVLRLQAGAPKIVWQGVAPCGVDGRARICFGLGGPMARQSARRGSVAMQRLT